jgi:polysaccharide export outer membrane protein
VALSQCHSATFLFGIALLWLLFGSAAPQAVAQTEAPSEPEAASDSQSLLEEARQRLIEQGTLLEPAPAPDLAVPVTTESDAEFDRYRLGPGDSIFVSVQRFNDLSFQTTLDLEGNIIVPIAGRLRLEGLTLPEARQQIQAALNQYIVDPQVDLTLVAQRPVQVSVLGEVVRPGIYPLAAPQISIALFSAGGTTRLADLRSVRIRRAREDGSVVERSVDLFTPLETAAALPDIRLVDGDAIIIPTLTVNASQNYDRSLAARSTLARPQITVRVLSYATGTEGRAGGGVISSITLPNGSNFVDALTAINPNPDVANLREIALVRFDPQQGRAVTQEVDARSVLRGDFSQNLPLENNDVIVVGRNFISRVTYALNTFTQPFRDILGFLLFFDTLADSADQLFRPGGD